ncbi:PAS domain-containing hybrid sensor histidine kinase/response regulator [Fulvivirga sediminis]|uniref:histidine kinase n=1 Tax=Fulvivirga sediminis TaxID=2803949 RepID=A0A937F7E0_9BACT|nr:ATP-binding protein [Fulvivirga sediminis]MBL3655695.1 response regulator [Fulvivirga sediminis]
MDKLLEKYIESGAFYKAVVEDGSDIIFIVDYDGLILYHNPSVEETLGHAPDSLIGEMFFDYLEPNSAKKVRAEFEKSIKKPYDSNIEFRFLCKDATYKYLEFNSINLHHKEGIEGLILDCRDISQRKKDAEELLRAQKAKEQFLANMSHEIRTPINGIAGMVNLLFEATEEDDRMKYLSAIKNSTESLKVIINDILDLSVIESGKLRFEKIGFNIKYQLSAVVDTFLFQSKEKGIDLKYDIQPEADTVLLGDPVRLNQILINLISNAIKFTHIGEITIAVSLERKEEKIHYISFSISDTGVGISEEKVQNIFESFTQADESVTRRYGGTGLGLSIVKQLIELQNGTIDVTSEENKGTTFTFVIPYESGKIQDLVQPSSKVKETPKYSFKGVKVLLVEDNDINRLYALNILKKWECEVDGAENGYIALEKLRSNDYDLILMDIQMPIMDGYEATKNIRQSMPDSKKEIPIIALTANAIKGDSERCLEVGMNDYLPKPFQPQDLYKSISKFISKKSSDSHKLPIPARITDLTYLKSICDGDKTFMRDMIETFLLNTPPTINEMQKWINKAEWLKVGHLAHKIKPSITFMGIDSLKPLIKNIEVYGKDNYKTDLIPTLVDELSEKCQTAYKELRKELETTLS